MKIRIYIVTYKKNEILNQNLASLWRSISKNSIDRVTIISNHPDVRIDTENQRENLHVIINSTRANNSWGNLAKDWNFGIIDGFRNWQNPEFVDWVLLAQNDVQWKEGWISKLEESSHLDFISQPRGDQVLAITIKAIREIGFFDERFSTLHYQEADYFIRSIIHLGDRSSINDDHKFGSSWNPVGSFIILPTYSGIEESENMHTMRFHPEFGGLLMKKWSFDEYHQSHQFEKIGKQRLHYFKNLPHEYNWYPFFWDKSPSLPSSLNWYSAIAEKFLNSNRLPMTYFLRTKVAMLWKKFKSLLDFWKI